MSHFGASVRFGGRQIQMLLDAAQSGLKVADDDAVSDHSGMVLDHRAAQADDLLGKLLAGLVHLASRLCRSDATSARSDFISERTSANSAFISERTAENSDFISARISRS